MKTSFFILFALAMILLFAMSITFSIIFLSICLRPDYAIGLEEQIAVIRWAELILCILSAGLAITGLVVLVKERLKL